MNYFGIGNSKVRLLVLSIFRKINLENISIIHHRILSTIIKLKTLKRKVYLWHRTKREKEKIDRFYKLIIQGDRGWWAHRIFFYYIYLFSWKRRGAIRV
mgnify:CR=1 FL=1